MYCITLLNSLSFLRNSMTEQSLFLPLVFRYSPCFLSFVTRAVSPINRIVRVSLCYCHSRFMSLYSSSYHSEVRNKLLFYLVVFFPSSFVQYPFIFIRVFFDPSLPAQTRSFTIEYTVNIPTIEFVYRLLVALLVAFASAV